MNRRAAGHRPPKPLHHADPLKEDVQRKVEGAQHIVLAGVGELVGQHEASQPALPVRRCHQDGVPQRDGPDPVKERQANPEDPTSSVGAPHGSA